MPVNPRRSVATRLLERIVRRVYRSICQSTYCTMVAVTFHSEDIGTFCSLSDYIKLSFDGQYFANRDLNYTKGTRIP